MDSIAYIVLDDETLEVEDTKARTDIGDVTTLKTTAKDNLVKAVNECFQSASDGKAIVASAITGKGVETDSDATFSTMANNISAIQVGIDTSNATATADTILSGKTAGVGGAIITGTMANNGAVSKTLGINGSYTIPAGYHNGAGKVTQNITTKAAATYTPGDSAQTIASGQYLSGTQTISAVPTETKTVTAGTSATTVYRTTGKYMTAVTVNPTPSQTKSVTMTSSPLTVTPDSGYLLSKVTVSANLGKKYATGTVSFVREDLDSNRYLQVGYGGPWNGVTSHYAICYFTLSGLGFTPSVILMSFTVDSNTYTTVLRVGQTFCVLQSSNGIDSNRYGLFNTRESMFTGTKAYIPLSPNFIDSGSVSSCNYTVYE